MILCSVRTGGPYLREVQRLTHLNYNLYKRRMIALTILTYLEPPLWDLRYPPKRGEKRPPIPGPPPLPRRERACSIVTLGLRGKTIKAMMKFK